jgi:prepilin-type N-terminal cleavage/methylation domain-containing protein
MKTTRAFTLTELLVVIVIIAVLAALIAPLVKSMMLVRDKAVAIKKLRDLGAGLSTYTFQNNGEFPLEGEGKPSWESAADPKYNDAWYNAIPRLLGKLGVGDYGSNQKSFYGKDNLLYIPAAKYPRDKESRPYFPVSINSKLRRKDAPDSTVRITNIEHPASTVIFQESGLPGEKQLPKQSSYDGQSKSYATRTVARYTGKTLVIFADGHLEELDARDIVNSEGKAYSSPQKGPGGGAVYWTIDPEADPND